MNAVFNHFFCDLNQDGNIDKIIMCLMKKIVEDEELCSELFADT